MVAQGAHPRNAQLSERNAFTIRYCFQSFHELERYVRWLCVNGQRAREGICKNTYITAPGIASTICE
jgi:hypothetical protein